VVILIIQGWRAYLTTSGGLPSNKYRHSRGGTMLPSWLGNEKGITYLWGGKFESEMVALSEMVVPSSNCLGGG